MLPPDQKAGLHRLLEAVSVEPKRRPERPDEIQRRLAFCLLWQPGDTVESFQRRNHQWSEMAVQNRLGLIRRRLGVQRYAQIKPYQIAQAYIALHPRYSRDIIPGV